MLAAPLTLVIRVTTEVLYPPTSLGQPIETLLEREP